MKKKGLGGWPSVTKQILKIHEKFISTNVVNKIVKQYGAINPPHLATFLGFTT